MGIRLNSGAIPVAVSNNPDVNREDLDLQATVSIRRREGIRDELQARRPASYISFKAFGTKGMECKVHSILYFTLFLKAHFK